MCHPAPGFQASRRDSGDSDQTLTNPIELVDDTRGLGREWVIYDVGGSRTSVRSRDSGQSLDLICCAASGVVTVLRVGGLDGREADDDGAFDWVFTNLGEGFVDERDGSEGCVLKRRGKI